MSDINTEPVTEYGLRTPNGEVHWGSYLGRPINTAEDRSIMRLVLSKTSQEVGFDEEKFLAQYRWVPRTVQRVDQYFAIADEAIAPSLQVVAPEAPGA